MPQARRVYNTHLDLKGNRLLNVGTLAPLVLAPTSTVAGVSNAFVLDFGDDIDNLQQVNIGLVSTFTTTNLAAGRNKVLLLAGQPAALALTLTFPVGWVWFGSKLTAALLSKFIRLELSCYGTTDADVHAHWIAQV